MKRTLALLLTLTSAAVWAQMPDRGSWVNDGGSGLPGATPAA